MSLQNQTNNQDSLYSRSKKSLQLHQVDSKKTKFNKSSRCWTPKSWKPRQIRILHKAKAENTALPSGGYHPAPQALPGSLPRACLGGLAPQARQAPIITANITLY